MGHNGLTHFGSKTGAEVIDEYTHTYYKSPNYFNSDVGVNSIAVSNCGTFAAISISNTQIDDTNKGSITDDEEN